MITIGIPSCFIKYYILASYVVSTCFQPNSFLTAGLVNENKLFKLDIGPLLEDSPSSVSMVTTECRTSMSHQELREHATCYRYHTETVNLPSITINSLGIPHSSPIVITNPCKIAISQRDTWRDISKDRNHKKLQCQSQLSMDSMVHYSFLQVLSFAFWFCVL